MTQHPPRATHTSPRSSSSHSGSASLPQQNKFCWAIKRRWKRGRPGERSESMPELLQVVTGLRVRANNAICPWDRGTRNTTTAAQTPNTGSRGRAGQAAGPRAEPGCPRARGDRPTRGCACGECGTGPMAPPVAPRCRAGWPCWPPCPHRVRHCTDAILLCRASSDSLLISRQRGGKRAGTSAEVGLFSGKTKAAWPVPRLRGCSGMEELPEDRAPKSGAASVRVPVALQGGPNPNPGQPHCPTCHPMAVGVCVTRPFV